LLSGYLPNISSNPQNVGHIREPYYQQLNSHIAKSSFLGGLPSFHHQLSSPSAPQPHITPVLELIKFNRHHNGEGREHHQIVQVKDFAKKVRNTKTASLNFFR